MTQPPQLPTRAHLHHRQGRGETSGGAARSRSSAMSSTSRLTRRCVLGLAPRRLRNARARARADGGRSSDRTAVGRLVAVRRCCRQRRPRAASTPHRRRPLARRVHGAAGLRAHPGGTRSADATRQLHSPACDTPYLVTASVLQLDELSRLQRASRAGACGGAGLGSAGAASASPALTQPTNTYRTRTPLHKPRSWVPSAEPWERFLPEGTYTTSACQPIGLMPRTRPFWVPLGWPRPTAGGYSSRPHPGRVGDVLEQTVAALVGAGPVEHEDPGPAHGDRRLHTGLDGRIPGGPEAQPLDRGWSSAVAPRAVVGGSAGGEELVLGFRRGQCACVRAIAGALGARAGGDRERRGPSCRLCGGRSPSASAVAFAGGALCLAALGALFGCGLAGGRRSRPLREA
jgi:hypothetical protein